MRPVRGIVVAVENNSATINLETGQVVNILVYHPVVYGDILYVYYTDRGMLYTPEEGKIVDDLPKENEEIEWLYHNPADYE